MNGRKAVALAVWTSGYLLVAGTLLILTATPDCSPGAEGTPWRALARQVQQGTAVALALAYVLLTWILLFRRR
jgi:hypothetical protein